MADSAPWITAESGPEDKKHAPATLRNRDAIVDVLREILPEQGDVLEIASGSGEHIIHFARAFPQLKFRPSDMLADACRSIEAYRQEEGLANIDPPVQLDVMASEWPVKSANAVLCINMVHISPWRATIALFAGCADILPPEGLLYLYGPYIREDVPTSDSNLAFDASLRSRDPEWGLRHISDMDGLAQESRFARAAMHEMPANNLSLVYRKL